MPPLIFKFQFYAGYPFHYSLDFYFFFLFSFMSYPVMGIEYRNFSKGKKRLFWLISSLFNFFFYRILEFIKN